MIILVSISHETKFPIILVIVFVFRLKLPVNFSYWPGLNVIAILVIDLVSCSTFS